MPDVHVVSDTLDPENPLNGPALDALEREVLAGRRRAFRIRTASGKAGPIASSPGRMHTLLLGGTGPYPSALYAKRYSPAGPFAVPPMWPERDFDKALARIARESKAFLGSRA